ncbi:hypothetical protein DFH09DRAFT_1095461 [Mycena vulgaris]|nr:hypothetical protein DFH09DRAFT_1095461 [Mycena vulgaris]
MAAVAQKANWTAENTAWGKTTADGAACGAVNYGKLQGNSKIPHYMPNKSGETSPAGEISHGNHQGPVAQPALDRRLGAMEIGTAVTTYLFVSPFLDSCPSEASSRTVDFMFFYLIQPKLFSNSMLAVLNGRSRFRSAEQVNLVSGPLFDSAGTRNPRDEGPLSDTISPTQGAHGKVFQMAPILENADSLYPKCLLSGLGLGVETKLRHSSAERSFDGRRDLRRSPESRAGHDGIAAQSRPAVPFST